LERISVELRQLRYFVCLAELLHFRKAAEKLHITQPPLSRAIRLLEEELGAKLLERGRKKDVRLTIAGEAFLEEARSILAASKQAKQRALMVAEGSMGSLTIAHTDDFLSDFFPLLVNEFSGAHPDITLSIFQDVSYRLAQRWVNDDYDCMLTTKPFPAHLAGHECIDLPPTEIVVAVAAHHRLGSRKRVRLREIAQENHLYKPGNTLTAFDVRLHELLTSEGVSIRSNIEMRSTGAQLALVQQNFGILFATLGSLPHGLDGITVLRIGGQNAELERALVWRRDNRKPALRKFVSFVRQKLKR
jgi:DNA-binding transcriptional LysR family regulator